MSCPVKFRALGDFPKYYAGELTAPYLTVFIGGNHEAASHLWELYYGGWVAPNIYYLGAANVLRLGPIRIAGMSGIWKGFDYNKPHHERLPFSSDDVRSFYHVREVDIRKLLVLQTQVDVGLSHDWPREIEKYGDSEALFRKKRDFRQESLDGTLGNVAAKYVMDRLRPPYWFSAHLHVKYAALKKYEDKQEEKQQQQHMEAQDPQSIPESSATFRDSNPDEIDLDMDDDDDDGEGDTKEKGEAAQSAQVEEGKGEKSKEASNAVPDDVRAQLPASFARPEPRTRRGIPGQPVPEAITNKEVRFLALDKCLPGRHFLQLAEIQPFDAEAHKLYPPQLSGPRYRLQYDPEWLAITRVFHKSLQIGPQALQAPPDLGEDNYLPMIEAERRWVEGHIVKGEKLDVPENFEITASPHVSGTPEIVQEQPEEYTNPQTAAYCDLLELENLWDATQEERDERRVRGPAPSMYHGGGGGAGGRGRGRGGFHRGGGGGGRGGRGGRGGGRGRGQRGGNRW